MPAILPDDHVRGAADAPLTIVQYGDYDCPHTRASTAIVRALEADLRIPVRFLFRYFPLRHLHANAEMLSEIAEAAAVLGSFWEVHERLMRHPHGITQRDVLDDLRTADIDIEALEGLLGSVSVKQRIERDVHAGAASGVHSTPTWFFNSTIWDGHYDRGTLDERVRIALATPGRT